MFFFRYDFSAELNTPITSIHRGTCNQFLCLALVLAAERTEPVFFCGFPRRHMFLQCLPTPKTICQCDSKLGISK